MPDHLFVYGTLLAPELRQALIGRAIAGVTATLPGYACFRVRRAPYPAMIARDGATTEGELIGGLSGADFDKLDAFESSLYRRIVVTVFDAADEPCEAYAYVIDDGESHRLSDEPWDYAAFRVRQLHRYLKAL